MFTPWVFSNLPYSPKGKLVSDHRVVLNRPLGNMISVLRIMGADNTAERRLVLVGVAEGERASREENQEMTLKLGA